MKTVLGLAVTPDGVGWVLVDGHASDGSSLDDDAFEVDTVDELAGRGVAAARGARAIAASSGQDIQSVGVTWCDGVESEAKQLIESLKTSGFDDVRAVPSRPADCGEDNSEDAGVQLSLAQTAAHAVATNAVTAQALRSVACRPCRARTSATVRVGGAAAAAVVVALLAVGSQSVVAAPRPAPEQPALATGGTPQVISVAVPRALTRQPAVVESEKDKQATKFAVRAPRTPVYEPPAVPLASPVVQAAQPAAAAEPPAGTPEAAPVANAHLPVAALPGPAAPQVFAPGPVPVTVATPEPAPPPAPWLAFFAPPPPPAPAPASPEPAPVMAAPPPPVFSNPFVAGLP